MSSLAGAWPFDANGAPVQGIESAAWHYGNAGSANTGWLQMCDRIPETLRTKLEAEYESDQAAARYDRIMQLREEP